MALGHGTPISPVAAFFQPPSATTSPGNATGDLSVAIVVTAPTAIATGKAASAGDLATIATTSPLGAANGKATAAGNVATVTSTALGGAAKGRAASGGTIGTITATTASATAKGKATTSGSIATVTATAAIATAGGKGLGSGSIGTVTATSPAGAAKGKASTTSSIGTIATSSPTAVASSPQAGNAFGDFGPAVTIAAPDGTATINGVPVASVIVVPFVGRAPDRRIEPQRRRGLAIGELPCIHVLAPSAIAEGKQLLEPVLDEPVAPLAYAVPIARASGAATGSARLPTLVTVPPLALAKGGAAASGDIGTAMKSTPPSADAWGLTLREPHRLRRAADRSRGAWRLEERENVLARRRRSA